MQCGVAALSSETPGGGAQRGPSDRPSTMMRIYAAPGLTPETENDPGCAASALSRNRIMERIVVCCAGGWFPGRTGTGARRPKCRASRGFSAGARRRISSPRLKAPNAFGPNPGENVHHRETGPGGGSIAPSPGLAKSQARTAATPPWGRASAGLRWSANPQTSHKSVGYENVGRNFARGGAIATCRCCWVVTPSPGTLCRVEDRAGT